MSRISQIYSEVFLYKFSKILSAAGGICLIVLAVITFLTVSIRLVALNFGLDARWLAGSYEFSELVMSMLFTLAVAWTWYQGGHIRIGIFRDSLTMRPKAMLDTVSALLATLFIAILVWAIWRGTLHSIAKGLTTDIKELPVAPFQIIYVIVMAHVFLVLSRSFLGLLAKVLGRHWGREPYLKGQ